MEDVKVRTNGGVVVPVFLAGLGSGVILTLLLHHGAAFRNRVSGRVKAGAERMEGRAAAARDEILTRATGLREGAKAVAETLTRS